MKVPITYWGIDHASTLLYAEARAVDNGGNLDSRKMRCHPDLHPKLNVNKVTEPSPTRLRDGSELEEHDDWSCLEDAEREGLLTLEYPPRSLSDHYLWSSSAHITLTDRGWRIIGLLRRHRAEGHKDNEFVFERFI